MRKSFFYLVLLFLLVPFISKAQGVISPDKVLVHAVTGDGTNSFTDSVHLSDLIIPPSAQSTCQAGYFYLYFPDPPGTGFNDNTNGPAYRNLACQVFSDLAKLIRPALEPYSNYDWYTNTQNLPLVYISLAAIPSPPPGLAGQGGFWSDSRTNSGVFDGAVYNTINGGTDWWYPYIYNPGTVYINTLNKYAHGFVNLNFSGSINWYFGTGTPSAAQEDMYTVILHEATHSLGFTSLLDGNGNSRFTGTNFFTRYDMFLHTVSPNAPVITNSTNCYNTQFNVTPSDLVNGACNMIFQGTSTPSVYTPSSFQTGSSLSHVDPTCTADPNSVMQWATPLGIYRRHLVQDEANILCDLGYNITGTFGPSSPYTGAPFTYSGPCSKRICGVNDVFYYSNNPVKTPYNMQQGTSITINDVLLNDDDNGNVPPSFACLSIIQGGGSLSNTTGASFTYTPNPAFCGEAILTYLPVSTSGARGNITYVYIHVECSNPCPTNISTTCEANQSCNLICHGTFESYNNTSNQYAFPLNDFSINGGQNTPDLYVNPAPTTNNIGCTPYTVPPDHDSPTCVNYVGMVGFVTNSEGIFFTLTSPMLVGNTYKISVWMRNTDNSCNPVSAKFVGSADRPCIPPNPTDPNNPTNCGNYTYTPVQLGTVTATNATWNQYFLTVPVTGSNINYIMVYTQAVPYPGLYGLYDDFEVRQVLTVNPISNVTIPCNGSTQLNAVTNSSNAVYSWSPSSGLSCTNCSNPTASPTVTTTYTVTVSDPAGCTSASTTVTVNVQSCNCTGNTVINATNYNNGLTNIISSSSPIAINGNIVVSNNTTLTIIGSPDVRMAPGVSITVMPGSTLNITTSHLYACNDMWDGIILNGFGALGNISKSTIEDAEHAVVSIGGAKYTVSKSHFNRNFVGIEVQAYSGTHNGTVASSTFTSWTTATSGIPALIVKSPHAGERSSAGITITDVGIGPQGIEVGSAPFSASTRNYFDYLDFGVMAIRSNVSVRNNSFNRIDFSTCPPNYNCFIGYAVYASGSTSSQPFSAVVGANALSQDNTFSSCFRNVFVSTNMNASVVSNKFTNILLSGVFVTQCKQRVISITNNTINGFKQEGIHCKYNQQANINIANNSVGNTTNDGEAIIVDEASQATTSNVTIGPGNRTSNVRIGIHIVNLSKPQIINNGGPTAFNQIRFVPGMFNPFGYGIWVQNCLGALVQQNFVRSNNGANVQLFGIVLENTTSSSVVENSIWHSGNGIYCYGTMNFTRLTCNYIGSNSINYFNGSYTNGIVLDAIPLGGIGPFGSLTSPSDNSWANPATGGFHTLMLNATDGSQIPWFTRNFSPFEPTLNGQSFAVALGPPGLNTSATGASVCYDPCACLACCRKTALGAIVSDSVPYSMLNSAEKKLANMYAYRKLNIDTSWITIGNQDDSLYQQFYSYQSGTSIGKLNTVARLIESGSSSDLAQATSINSSVADTSVMESNQKIVNDIYLQTIALGIDTFSEQQTQQLQTIAYENPTIGGNAVFGARVMLDLHIDIIVPVLSARYADQNYVQNSANTQFKIYPNPASDQATLDYVLDEGETGHFEIYSMLGDLVASFDLVNDAKQLTFSTKDMKPGVYIYRITTNTGAISSGRLVIIRE